MKYDDEELLANTLWALSFLCDGEVSQIEEILRLEIVERLIELLKWEDLEVKVPALKSLTNLLTGDDEQIDYLIKQGAIGALEPFLEHAKKLCRKEAVWAFSNIFACSSTQIEEVFNYKNEVILDNIFQMIAREEPDVNLFHFLTFIWV